VKFFLRPPPPPPPRQTHPSPPPPPPPPPPTPPPTYPAASAQGAAAGDLDSGVVPTPLCSPRRGGPPPVLFSAFFSPLTYAGGPPVAFRPGAWAKLEHPVCFLHLSVPPNLH